jgi:ribosome biogenesis SPOUT family RNA methylase Rps3
MVGKIVIQEVMEHEDGSATVTFECDNEAKEALISEGILSLITKAVDKYNEDYNWMKGEAENED